MSDTPEAPRKPWLQTLELDTRLLGMIGAFVILSIGFDLLTDGRFLTPRNVFNLTIQTVSVAIMATGMVFVIVTRNIDLSVGALLATCSAVMAMMQTSILPDMLGIPLGSPLIAPVAIVSGLAVGALIGAFQGYLIGYLVIPSFIVTLGGLLVWRNTAWYMTSGQTIGPLDKTFQIFGGTNGTMGVFWSWLLAALAVAFALYGMWAARRNKRAHGFTVKPLWAELVMGGLISAAILGFVGMLTAYQIPTRRLARLFQARGETMPEGYTEAYGLPISVLVLIMVAIGMTVIATRTRFGRYIFATGGNPDAAELSGINTRMLTVKVFALMGALTALSDRKSVV